MALGLAIAMISPPLPAQFRVPQPERKTPRAVGVLETFPNGTRRLVPVTFFYERRYYDAASYRATPVPFTLYPETVYEVQQFGKAVGTFTILNAAQSGGQNAETNTIQWSGSGRYKTAPDPALLAKKAAARPVVLEDSSRPVLHRRAGSDGDNPVAHPAPRETPAAEVEDDPERPKLHRRADAEEGTSAPASASPASTPAASSASASAAASPAAMGSTSGAGATQDVKPSAATGSAQELTPSDDPDHPVLRRGKPGREQSGRDLPEFHAGPAPGGGAAGTSGAAAGGYSGNGGSDEAMTRQVAVSDAGASETQTLTYLCREEERRQMETSARELARAELRRLAVQRGLVLPAAAMPDGAKSAAVKASAVKANAAKKQAAPLPAAAASDQAASQTAAQSAPRRASQTAPQAELKLAEEQFVAYDLDYNNYATVVFSARYLPQTADAEPATKVAAAKDSAVKDGSAASAGGTGASAKGRSWVVTVIAREDEGKLVKLYSAVSDPRELDLYPEVRLVDAVDPDGYGRYGLLLREQKRDGVSWLLGRPTGYELQTVFETAVR